MPDRKIKVVIADQQPLFRQGVHYSLIQAPDIQIVAEAGTEADLVTAVVNETPDVVLLDISEQTIKNNVTSILRKLDANARTQAVITAVRRGIISLS